MENRIQAPTSSETPKEPQPGFQINPKIYIIAFFLFLAFIIIMGILTRVLPQGAYERKIVDGAEYIVDGTYHLLEDQTPLPIWRWFSAPFELMVTSSGLKVMLITASMMFIGGLYAVLDQSGLLKRFLSYTVRRLGKRKYLMLAVISITFVIFGSVIGEIDNFVLLVPFFVALSFSLGWDSFVGVAMVYVAAIRGFAASTFNPYTIGVAQTMADVPLFSGLWLRIIILVVSTVFFMWWLLSYARRIEKDPLRSLMYNEDLARRESYTFEELVSFDRRRYPFKEMLVDFVKGALPFLPLLLIGAMILSLSFILTEGQVLDTVIYSLSNVIASASPTGAALLMLLVTCIVEVFIPGSVVKVYVLMPIFVPLGDLVGISRQVVCLIYILGDSFVNMLYPTDMVLMVVLGIIGSNYFKWLRWIGGFMLGMVALCIAIIIFAVQIGYS